MSTIVSKRTLGGVSLAFDDLALALALVDRVTLAFLTPDFGAGR